MATRYTVNYFIWNKTALIDLHGNDHIECILSAAEAAISLIKMYEANYPEILKCCYIINGNKRLITN